MTALLNNPPAIDAELAVVLRWLEFGMGTFSSGLATCNSPALRDSLIVQIREAHPEVTVVEIPAKTVDVYGYVMDHYPSAKALFLIGLEASISSPEDYSHTLRSLNASRDLWPVRYPSPILLWLPEYAVTALQRQARDYWRFISNRFYFAKESADAAPRSADIYSGEYLNAINLSHDEKLERIHELKSRLASVNVTAIPAMQQHALKWWNELATLHQFMGTLDEALRIYREEQLPVYERLGVEQAKAVTMGKIADILQQRGQTDEALRDLEAIKQIFHDLGDVRSKAVTMGSIADILQQRGQTDEALRIRREEELPVYERLGDVQSKAVTMGKIADILQQRGQTDEALRIRCEEELPVFERLGDVQSKAVTMGRIADILQQRGQTDEALLIRREEELPAYERLGDVQAKAVTMGRIADILQLRGQTDEALRIRREEELPVFERLGDVRSKAVTMGKIADILVTRGEIDEALRIYRELLPILESVGDLHSQMMCRGQTGIALLKRGWKKDRAIALEHLRWALATAEKHQYAEAAELRSIVQSLLG